MRLTSFKNTVLGIAVTVMYPIMIMVVAFLVCLLISRFR